MRIEVLGHIEAIGDEPLAIGGPTQRRLLGVLALHHGDVVSVDHLIDVTWFGGDAPSRAERNVHSYMHRLRSSLNGGGDRIETVGAGYRLRLDPGELDLEEFDELAATARREAEAGEAVSALEAITGALTLWHGPPFGEFASEPWAVAEVTRAVELNVALRELRAELLLELGRPGDVVAEMDGLAREHPFREGPRALQMQALYHAGRQAEALRVFQGFRRLLIDEVGLEPSDDLIELDRRIAAGAVEPPRGARERTIGAYVLGERIGEGAFAVVYRATQPALGRDVAIKVVRAELANRPEFVRRFEAEAQMVARIEHPNVVPLYDFWREPDRAYFVMRLMNDTLEARLDAGPIGADEAGAIVAQVAAALSAAHDVGVVHRDVKPENVMFDGEGRAYLTDFGIALESEERAHPEAALSEGSPRFASPEQLRREPVGPEADVHALGVVAFTMLVGHAPFVESRDDAERLRRQLEEPIPSVRGMRPELPEAVDRVLATATAKRPEDRYPSTLAFAAAFDAAINGTDSVSIALMPAERINPYKGLRAFDETDAGDFYGRVRLVDELSEAVATSDARLLAIVGPSGSGKSSVVRAGLLPALRSGRIPGSAAWFTTTMTPGKQPYEALETALLRIAVNPPGSLLEQLQGSRRGILRGVRRALPDDGTNLLIVIDQFEELFTNDVDPTQRDKFFDALAAATEEPGTPLRVVLTLRADFFDRPLRHPALAALVKRRTVAVTPLAADELEHAIVDPAASVGVGFEPGVVARVVADVTSQPGALPLLQYALTEMFDRAEGDLISEADYEAVGGITGSLARRADELWTDAEPPERTAIRRLFERLVNLGEGVQDTRRRVARSDLGGDPAMADAIDRYGRARLLTFDRDPATRQPTVEVAHEALLQQWPRLRDWLDEDRADLRTLHTMNAAADDWAASDRDPGGLARGGRLEAVNDLAARHEDWINEREREWIDASTQAAEAEAADRAAIIARDRRQNRRLRSLLVVAGVLVVFATVAGIAAVARQRQSDANAREADFRRVVGRSSQALIDGDPSLALLLAAEAYRIQPSNETLGAIQRAGAGSPTDWLGDIVNGSSYSRVQFLPDGSLVAVSPDALEIWDLGQRAMLRGVSLDATPGDLDVAAGGELIAIGREDGGWAVHRADTLDVVASGEVDGAVNAIELDDGGDVVALGTVGGEVYVRGLTDTSRDRSYEPVRGDGGPIEDAVQDLAIRADGHLLAAAWGLGAEVQQFELEVARTEGVSLEGSNPSFTLHYEGDLLYTLFRDVKVFDSDTGELVGEPIDRNTGLDFNATLDVLADGTIQITDSGLVETIDVDGSRDVRRFPARAATQSAIAHDGSLVAIGTRFGLSLWAGDGAGAFVDVVVPAADGSLLHSISRSGDIVVQGGNQTHNVPTKVWDVSGAEPVVLTELEPGFGVRQSDDEVFTYKASGEPVFEQVDLAQYDRSSNDFVKLTSTELATFGVYVPVISPDGAHFLHTWNNGQGILDVYDAASGDRLERLTHLDDASPPFESFLHVPRFSPDGTVLVQPSFQEYVGVYDPSNWELIDLLEGDDGFQEIVFSPDGNKAFTSSTRGLEMRDPDDLRAVLDGPVPIPGDAALGRTLEIASDGRWLKTAVRGGAQLWDPDTLEPIGALFPTTLSTDWAATLAADTNQLATINDDLETLIWNVELTEWPDLACFAAGRNMTRDEWDQFGPAGGYHATCDRWPSG